jgi:hypothetical protein
MNDGNPVICPNCGCHGHFKRKLEVEGEVVYLYACDTCQHTWMEAVPDALPKPLEAA